MDRTNPFADMATLPTFEPKPKVQKAKEIEQVETEKLNKLAQESGFPSRQPKKEPAAPAPRKRRTYTTGRNRQINFKATNETIERFYRMADERRVALCELLEEALNALEHTAK